MTDAKIYPDSSNRLWLQDSDQPTARDLDSIVKGENSAHGARHDVGGEDPVTNVDKIDGYDAGNAEGNIPVSNGTVNTNLNADKVDGFDASQTPSAGQIPVLDANGDLDFPADRTIKTDVKASAYLSANQENLTNNTWTKVTLDAENFDVGSDFDTTNSRFTAPVTGYYQVSAQVTWYSSSAVADKRYMIKIYKNGDTDLLMNTVHSSLASSLSNVISCLIYLSANDYIELWANQGSGVDTVDIYGGSKLTYMTVHLHSV